MTETLSATGATAQLLVSGTDAFALGHYPGNPIYPGVLILDRLAELAEGVAREHWQKPAALHKVKRVQYLSAVLPGDVVQLNANVKPDAGGSEDLLEFSVSARVGERSTTRATLVCQRGRRAMAPVALRAHAEAPALSHQQLLQVLPHRYPFLLLDRVESFEEGQWLRASRVLNHDPLLHTRSACSYPSALALESIGQAGIALFFLSGRGKPPADVVLGSMGEVELPHSIPFRSRLSLHARIDRLLPNAVVISGEAHVGELCVARVGSLVAMLDPR